MSADEIWKCSLCGAPLIEATVVSICDPCVRGVTRARSAIESIGGSLIVVEGRIVVRSALERSQPGAILAEIADIRKAMEQR